MIQEQRKHPRYKIHQLVEISFNGEEFIHASGLNISEGGLLCATESLLSAGNQVFLMLELESEEGPLPVTCEGTVVRSENKEGQNLAAVEFFPMNEKNSTNLKNFIAQLG